MLHFFQALNSCGLTVQSPSSFDKRSLNEHVTVERKRAISVPNVGINASFFEEFERKLNLLGGNIINTGKFILFVMRKFMHTFKFVSCKNK